MHNIKGQQLSHFSPIGVEVIKTVWLIVSVNHFLTYAR